MLLRMKTIKWKKRGRWGVGGGVGVGVGGKETETQKKEIKRFGDVARRRGSGIKKKKRDKER